MICVIIVDECQYVLRAHRRLFLRRVTPHTSGIYRIIACITSLRSVQGLASHIEL